MKKGCFVINAFMPNAKVPFLGGKDILLQKVSQVL